MRMLCVKCFGPREEFYELRPGVYQYAPCKTCGSAGILRSDLRPLQSERQMKKKRDTASRYRRRKVVEIRGQE